MTAPPAGKAAPSLRIRMLRHVMVPLVLTWLAGTVATLSGASHFTEQAFARALLDDWADADVAATERMASVSALRA